eukprot:gene12142-16256_t
MEDNNRPMFYIYEWPDELDDVWPPVGAKLDPKSGYSPEFRNNNGAGTMLDNKVGLFNTWQFSLYRNMITRLRVSEHRTRDPEKATAFIIPFDLGVHSYIDHFTGKPRLASPHGWAASYFLINGSKDKKLWWKNHGHDHFILFSITAYQMVGIGVKVFFMQICQNCSTITIETSPTKTAIKGRTRKHWYAAPYPSSFHWYEGIQQLPWEIKESYPKRDILALLIGSVKTSQPSSNYLRKLLYTQCEQDTQCQWHKTAHSCSGIVNATDTMLLLRRAVFCPAPTGDSITRKSLFDSLVAGCIPVLFSRASLSQYSWHLSEEDINNVAVYIPMKIINEQNENFLKILSAISPEEILKKQKAIAVIAPRLQYSIVPSHIGNGTDGKIWKSPFKDAGEVIIEKILDKNTVAPLHGFSDEELLKLVEKQNDIMDNHEDYAALRPMINNNKKSEKKELTKGIKGISKILTYETIGYPSYGALLLSSYFIPQDIFKNTDVVEYKEGKARYITDSKHGQFGYYHSYEIKKT